MDTETRNRSDEISLNLWCFLGTDEETKHLKLNLDTSAINLQKLKEFVCKEVGSIAPEEIDILYNGGKLKDDAAVQTAIFQPLNVVTVIKRRRNVETKVDMTAAVKAATAQISQVALGLKTAFYNPSFMSTIEVFDKDNRKFNMVIPNSRYIRPVKLSQSEKLQNLLAVVPGLKEDPVGVAIIQDPAMIFHLSDVDSLKKLAKERPWIVEAFSILAGSVHQDKGPGASGRSNPPLYHPLFDGEDDDDMDEDDAEGAAARNNSRITREQLSAALNSLSAFGRGGLAGVAPQPSPSQNPVSSFLDVLSQSGVRSTSATGSTPSSQGPTSGLANPAAPDLSSLLASASGGQQLTPEMVARAMTTAFNTLSPAAREGHYNALREQINRIQNMGNNTSSGTPPPQTTAPSQPPVADTSSGSSSSGQYQSQLHQMREMGIQDERLSILALRVSDGDVGTAVDLILSGWTGEGADVHMSDEE